MEEEYPLYSLDLTSMYSDSSTQCFDVEAVVLEVQEPNQMYYDVRREIEMRQGQRCRLPYRNHLDLVDAEVHIDGNGRASVHVDDAVQQAFREKIKRRCKRASGRCCGRWHCRLASWAGPWTDACGTRLRYRSRARATWTVSTMRSGSACTASASTYTCTASGPDMRCLAHSHSPFTSALSLLGQELLVSHMDTMVLYEDVQYLRTWPGIPFGDEEGDFISAGLGETHWAALLAHHGLFVGGRSIEEAT